MSEIFDMLSQASYQCQRFMTRSQSMSFRYKSALLSLISMAAVYAWYFAFLVIHFRTGHPFNPVSHLVGTILLLVFIQIVGHVIIAGTSSDKYGAPDERERGFDRRATMVGYYVLI